MTQVLAAITEGCAFLVADRRLTYGSGKQQGQVASNNECKVVSLCHVNAIGYTGLAQLDRRPTNEWIGVALAEAGCCHAGHAVEVLKSRAPLALPQLAATLRLQADEKAAVFGVGEHLPPEREVALLRSIRRAMDRDGFEAAVMRILAEEVFQTSSRTSTVGDQVQACCIPIASAHSLFSSGGVRMSGLRARTDRSTFGYFDRGFNEYKQFAPTFVCGGQAFTDIKYERSRTGPETSISFRALHAPKAPS